MVASPGVGGAEVDEGGRTGRAREEGGAAERLDVDEVEPSTEEEDGLDVEGLVEEEEGAEEDDSKEVNRWKGPLLAIAEADDDAEMVEVDVEVEVVAVPVLEEEERGDAELPVPLPLPSLPPVDEVAGAAKEDVPAAIDVEDTEDDDGETEEEEGEDEDEECCPRTVPHGQHVSTMISRSSSHTNEEGAGGAIVGRGRRGSRRRDGEQRKREREWERAENCQWGR